MMSLVEAFNLYQLREQQRLHTHPLFQIARSWGGTRSDGQGDFYAINQTDLDDPDQPFVFQGGTCCLCSCCPPDSPSDGDGEVELAPQGLPPPPRLSPAEEAAARAQREQRRAFLRNVEDQQSQRNKSIRQLEQ